MFHFTKDETEKYDRVWERLKETIENRSDLYSFAVSYKSLILEELCLTHREGKVSVSQETIDRIAETAQKTFPGVPISKLSFDRLLIPLIKAVDEVETERAMKDDIRSIDIADITEGHKFDEDKPRFDLIPVKPLEELAHIFTVGAKRYSDKNWENGILFSRLYSALMRHLMAWRIGEDLDPEDSCSHIMKVAWYAFAIEELIRTKPEFDDRKESKDV